ncbi:hypothetical protein H5410_052608 [Solanum commersonii]|uniref:Uncharacterized protein n=1 Tax=Solanum commersonii TaxID=4109 RepID=A0A9J5X3I7_SOLCO|nr:hypothetical protein H5410_052608 [Solanum commersonii]
MTNDILVEWIWASDYRSRKVRQCNLAFGDNPFNTIKKNLVSSTARGVLISLAHVLVVSIEKIRKFPYQTLESLFNYTQLNSFNSKLLHTHLFRFLDKATIVIAED